MKFKNLQTLENDIQAWQEDREKNKLPLTITSLAYALKTTRDTLLDYEYGESEHHLKYSDTIKRAKMLCHVYAEDQLFIGKTEGAKFNLKNNYGWKDRTEQELTGKNGGPIETKEVLNTTEDVNEELKKRGIPTPE